MTIDIHKAIGKLPIIPKKGFTLPNMNYCGPYNPLDKQVIYDENGNIINIFKIPQEKLMLFVLNMILIMHYLEI